MMFKERAVTEDFQTQKMADKCDLCLLGLIIHSSLLTGTSGVDETDVFISSDENVRLPCNNALSDCSSTYWVYYNISRHSVADELIGLGIKNKDTERHERLSLGSDCSLNIKNVTKEDYGFYSCRQWTDVDGQLQKQRNDTRVYLHVLHVSVSPSSSSSSSQTEISPGRSVTLSCQLYSVFSNDLVRSEGLQLLWVNQAGVDLTTDSRYQILFSSDHCIITLTTTLLNEDDNREWRCQLTLRNQLQTSVRYTVKSSVVPSTTATPTPDVTPNSLNPVIVIVIVVASFAVLLPALILWMIRRKRDDNRRGTDDSEDQQTRPVYPTGQNTLLQQEQTDDHVTYSEVTAYSKNQDKKNKVRCDDKVTYASIRGAKAGSQENCSELYASVNKNITNQSNNYTKTT
ncbi:CXADR-like membrane protein isoform X3 [Ctenopharyngodon idella]|uniref:CXADR-like membrane protein isoform X3 n=1 Tax=Ctenopharyngodon idella TaxID=7959 RepID=UPI00222EAD97|nr:CXADR-like membrane protein isoform X3 [Ctenopharyngodon idella]